MARALPHIEVGGVTGDSVNIGMQLCILFERSGKPFELNVALIFGVVAYLVQVPNQVRGPRHITLVGIEINHFTFHHLFK